MKITKRKDGYWAANVKIAPGKYKKVYGKTKKEVNEKANNILKDVNDGVYVDNNSLTVESWFNYYLKECTLNLKSTTKRRYTMDIKNHIVPYLGKRKLQSLKPIEIQQFINHLSSKLSPKSVKNCYGVLNKGLSIAVDLGKLNRNPCQNIILPKNRRKEMSILNESQIPQFLENAYKMSEYGDFYELILLTGLRFGEASGLTVEQYNRQEGYLLIDRQQISKGSVPEFSTPKHDVIRKVYLGDRAKEIIENRIKLNDGKKAYGYEFIFINSFGNFFKNESLNKYLKIIVNSIGINYLRVHDLRHTYASMSLKSGVDIKTLQNNLGHATAGFTLQVYGHTTTQMKQNSANLLEKMISTLH